MRFYLKGGPISFMEMIGEFLTIFRASLTFIVRIDLGDVCYVL